MDQLNWIYDVRSRALMVLGRGADAIESMNAGAQRPEGGGANISQQLNLAWAYVTLDRPSEALKVVSEAAPNLNGYASMVREGVRVGAYAQLHDQAGLNKAIGYMKAHAADSPKGLIAALLTAGDMDAAARETIVQLRDALQRTEMLALLQDGLIPETAPDIIKQRQHLYVALRKRPDVKAAIDEVGRIETIPLY
jgi:hypothetical protein